MLGMRWIGVALAAFLLAGCSAAESGEPDDDPTATESLPAHVFYDFVREHYPQLADVDTSQIEEIANAICDTLKVDDVDSWLQAVKAVTESGYSGEDAGGIIGVSTRYACPEKAGAAPDLS